jgi:Zn-finger nucleic acid-binding protein
MQRMGLKDGENLNVVCPCCQAKLVVDPTFGAVLSHEAPVKAGPNVDLTDAQKILAEQNRQREDKFADSWFKESNKEDILAKKFEEAMKKAKDAPPGKPIRDFDLD